MNHLPDPPSDGIPYPGMRSRIPAPTGWHASAYADGVPAADTTELFPAGPPEPEFAPDDVRGNRRKPRINRILAVEGPRGHATRATVWMRYFMFLVEVLILSAITGWFTQGVPWATGGGRWMLIASTVMLVAGALATMRHPNERNNIIREARKYVLAIALRPGTAIAFFIWGSKGVFDEQTSNAMSGLLINALPIVFFTTLFLPTAFFVKYSFGLGHLNRSMEDNQALVARYTRQDDMQR